MNILVRDIFQFDVLGHAPERRDTRTCAYQEKIFLVIFFIECKDALWSTEGEFSSYFYIIKQPGSTRTSFQQYDHEFNDIRAIGPAGDGITTPSLVWFFVDGKVEGDELTRLKIERLKLGDCIQYRRVL